MDVNGGLEAHYRKRGPMYEGLSLSEWYDMLTGEDPDDRAIREAHGIGYREDPDDPGVQCGACGTSYADISSGKMRTCRGVACA